MKICMVTSSYPRYEGDFAGTFVKSLAEALSHVGHDVHVLAAHDPDILPNVTGPVKLHYFRYAAFRQAHVLGYARSLKSDARIRPLAAAIIPIYLVSGTAALIKLNAINKFDIIHAHWLVPCGPIGAFASVLFNVPFVVSLHGSDVFIAERNRFFAATARVSLRTAQAVAACSDDLRIRAIKIGVPEAQTQTVPYGVDVQAFSRAPSSGQVQRSLKPSRNDPLVLAAGRLVGKKGFEYFIKAIPLIMERVPSARFAIIGDGDDKERLITLARELRIAERMTFVGAVPWTSMPEYLSACDVFVVPSIRDKSGNVDGLPNTLLEAMAAGKPVVATRIAGIPRAIIHDIHGLLVAEKSHIEIANAVTLLLQSPQLTRQLGKSAQERVRDHFSWEGVAQTYTEIYESAQQAKRQAC